MPTNTLKSRKPQDTAFKQQRLNAWHPILTPAWVIGTFALIGICFIPIGLVLYSASSSIVEYTYQYDGDGAVSDACKVTSEDEATVSCTVEIEITEEMAGTVYVYYQLDNFYQNHRRYVKSRDDTQLSGTVYTEESELDACDPLVTYTNDDTDETVVLSPCGLIANSFFNDVIKLSSSNSDDYTLDESGIAWESDIAERFKQPDGFKKVKSSDSIVCGQGSYAEYSSYTGSDGIAYCYYYPDDEKIQYLYETYAGIISPLDGVTDEHFIVWMRTAGLPTFRKLYGKIENGISKGTKLTFDISANFEVSSFDGKKSLVISTTSWFGGKNLFLGISYITVGCLCLLLSLIFVIKQIKSPRRLGDTRFLGWKEF